MSLSLYNTLSGRKEEFSPLKAGDVGIYACGATVYDEPHIGHIRSALFFDCLVRFLKFKGYKVRFVKNVTDIDDKIINRARQELAKDPTSCPDLKSKAKEIAVKYTDSYHRDMGLLGIAAPDIEPRATEHIPEMIELISSLIQKGFAYQVGADVYFKVREFKDYGKLSKQTADQMMANARIDPNEKKQDHLDFALWKGSKPDEPSWKSPWSDGRPGWHIECSAMSRKYLGESFDIHGGGLDLKFPHHENEIAQSEASNGKPFAKYWIHHGLLTINGQKMAKSLGNFITIDEILKKFPADVLKIFFLQAHYASPVDFTWEKMEEAKKAYEGIYILIKNINRKLSTNSQGPTPKKIDSIEALKSKYIEALDDDINTPQALSAIFDLVHLANKNIDNTEFISGAKNILGELLDILGIRILKNFEGVDLSASDDASIKALVEKRSKLKIEKKFTDADEIRKGLEAKGIIIEDTKEGVTWRRKL